jgi:hypothetical protein
MGVNYWVESMAKDEASSEYNFKEQKKLRALQDFMSFARGPKKWGGNNGNNLLRL